MQKPLVILGMLILATTLVARSAGGGNGQAARAVAAAGVPNAPGLYVFDASDQALRLLIPGADEREDVEWSPGGNWIASTDTKDFLVDVVQPTGGKVRDLVSLLWSPNGSRVAYSTSNGLFVASSSWGKVRRVVRGDGSALDWAADGSRFIFGDGHISSCCSQSLKIARASGAGVRALWAPPGDGPDASWINEAAWSPSGLQIALDVTINNGVAKRKGGEFTYLVDPSRHGAKRLSIRGHGTFGEWSGDGRWLILEAGDSFLRVSPKGGKAQPLCPGPCKNAGLSPDRRRFAFETTTGAPPSTTLWVASIDGSGVQRVGELPGPGAIDWAPDGHKLGLTLPQPDGVHSSISVADLATGQIQQLTDGSTIDFVFGGLSSDGSVVAFGRVAADNSPELWVVSAQGGDAQKVMTLSADPDLGPCPHVAWSPKAPLLAVANEACAPS